MAGEHHDASPRSHGNGGLLLLGGMGLGALFMYLGDPQLGRRRRALLRDQYTHAARKLQCGTDVVLRDAANRAHGLVAAARGRVAHGREHADDAVVAERVRAALGRVTSHPHAVEVSTNDGHVDVKGVALSREHQAIVSCIRKVPGVRSVADHLQVYESPQRIPSLQGGVTRRGARPEFLQDNWSPAWRSLAGAIGAGLTLAGWIRGGLGGLLMGTAGGGLLARAATNADVRSILGVGAACRGVVVQKTIHVDAPVEEVYRHWTIENFPQWMSHVRQVTPLGVNRHHWVVDGPAQVPVEWESEITRTVENRSMEWRSAAGSMIDNAGRVTFAPHGGGTRVQVTLCYMPIAGMIGHAVAKALGSDPRSRMDDDLMRFKSLIETGRPPHDAAGRRGPPAWQPPSSARH